MLEGMRAATQTWFGRTIMALIMGFIILSFAIWGIGDIFRGFGANNLARVGGTDITVDAYRNAYQNELQRLQRQARRGITNEEARRLGLDTQVLSRLLSEAVLDQKARALGLAISDQEIAKAIINDESFKGVTGHFDQARFQELLRDNGMTERSFVAAQRGVYLRQEITDAITGDLQVPKAMLAAIHRYQAETRSVDYIVLPPAAAGDIAAPTAEELQKYFDDRKQIFRTPEFRKLVTLAVNPTAVAKPDDVSDADAQKRYDEVKGERFGAPEKRAIEQLTLPDLATAAEAKAKLDAGQSFEALVAERKLTPQDVDLGTVTRASLVDKAVADAAFALPEGGVSAPVQAQFGVVLLHVTKIIPESMKPFSEVSADLKREIAVQRARAEVIRLHDAIEDQRSAGKTLSEAAKSAGLEARQIDDIDAAGRDKQGAPVPGLTDGAALLKAAFASDIGVDNDTITTPDGGYVWFEVAAIDPARQETLDEVKPKVEQAWRDDETAKRLAAKTVELSKRLDGGETMAAIAQSLGNLEIKHASDVKRSGGTGLSPGAVAQIFNVAVKQAGSATEAGDSRLLFQVLDSVVPPMDTEAPDLQSIASEVKTGFLEDVLAQYLGKLRTEIGVSVNPQALQAATGAADSN